MSDLSAHFSRSEFACKCGCGFDTVDSELLTMLETVRQHFELPMKIMSGCRCITHNESVGGAANSQHLVGKAADIKVHGILPAEVQAYTHYIWPDQYGIGTYSSFTHLDSRSVKARWEG